MEADYTAFGLLKTAFLTDIGVNELKPIRRKFWLFLFLRLEQACGLLFFKKCFALLKKISLWFSGSELPSTACAGKALQLPHLSGIIVSPYARIGNNCTIMHQVTLGVNAEISDCKAPVLGDNVFVGAGAKLIGPIIIGSNVKIGANAVVTKNVPDGVTVVGANRFV
ncbi:MAG: serine acetyltransferase [Odoribacter sp.]